MSDPSISPNSKWDAARAKEFLLSLTEPEFYSFRRAVFDLDACIAQYYAEKIEVPQFIIDLAQSRKIQAIRELRAWWQDNRGEMLSLMTAKLAVEKHL